MSGYYGFKSKKAYEKHYSGPLPQWEIDAMEAYSKEADAERESFKMPNETKACNLTENEIKKLIIHHGYNIDSDYDGAIDRIKYLNSRLKTFKEEAPKTAEVQQSVPAPTRTGW